MTMILLAFRQLLLLHIPCLCSGDVVTTTSFLARRVAPGRWQRG
jgi:hypothetical protein